MKRRCFLMTAAAPVFVAVVRVAAQERRKHRIAWLVPAPPTDRRWDAFKMALTERGWREGQDFTVEWQPTHGRTELVEQAAKAFAEQNVDVMVAASTATALTAQRASRSIPIVMLTSGFPVEAGVAATLRRPGSNVTGNTIYAGGEVFGKLIGLLRDIRPTLSHVGVLWGYSLPAFPERENAVAHEEIKRAGEQLGVRVSLNQIQRADDVDRALSTFGAMSIDGLLVTSGSVIRTQRDRIIHFVKKYRVPVVSDFALPEERNDRLLIYGADSLELARQAARYVDQILRGAKPGELPIMLPSRFVLTVNLQLARTLGVPIPPSVLLRADEVIQ